MSKQFLLLFLLITCYFSFFWIGDLLPANIMEARNLITAREILETGNWLSPQMNGLPRLEKPPLPTWITAVFMHIWGQDNISILRIPAGLITCLLVFFIFKISEELTTDKLVPYMSAITAASSFYIYWMSRTITWDIFCHSFMLGAIWMLIRGLKKESNAWKEFIIAGILMGLSFMSKGPVAFYSLLIPFLFAYATNYKANAFRIHWKPILTALTIALIIGLWWPIYIYFTHAELLESVIRKETNAWISRRVRPWHYYWHFTQHMGLWIIVATTALIFPYSKKRIEQYGNYNFLAVWVWTSVVLLSIFPEKKERYLFPVFIVLTFLTSFYFRYIIQAYKSKQTTLTDRIFLGVNSFCISAFVLGGFVYIQIIRSRGDFEINGWIFGLIACAIVSVSIGIILSFIKKKATLNWVMLVTLNTVLIGVLFPFGKQIAGKNPEFNSLNNLRYDSRVEGMKFYHDPMINKNIKLTWDTNMPFSPVHFQDLLIQLVQPNPMRVVIGHSIENTNYNQEKFFGSGLKTRYLPYNITNIKMQLVWEVGRPMIPWHSEMGDEPFRETQCVLVTKEHPESFLPEDTWDNYELEYIGLYDDNFIKSHRSLGSRLRNHVVIIRKKTKYK